MQVLTSITCTLHARQDPASHSFEVLYGNAEPDTLLSVFVLSRFTLSQLGQARQGLSVRVELQVRFT